MTVNILFFSWSSTGYIWRAGLEFNEIKLDYTKLETHLFSLTENCVAGRICSVLGFVMKRK